MNPTVGELFAGYGGFGLAFESAGFEVVWQVEIDTYATQVLEKNFPDADRYGDIHDCYALPYVDVITAGFPCQPFSVAGKRRGSQDERFLVREMMRVIEDVKPQICLLENVAGFLTMHTPLLNILKGWVANNIGSMTACLEFYCYVVFYEYKTGDTITFNGSEFARLLRAFAEIGYDCEWDCVRASDVGAPHRRERWLLVAYPNTKRWREIRAGLEYTGERVVCTDDVQHTESQRTDADKLPRRWDGVIGTGETLSDTDKSRCNNWRDYWRKRHLPNDFNWYAKKGEPEWRRRECGIRSVGATALSNPDSDGFDSSDCPRHGFVRNRNGYDPQEECRRDKFRHRFSQRGADVSYAKAKQCNTWGISGHKQVRRNGERVVIPQKRRSTVRYGFEPICKKNSGGWETVGNPATSRWKKRFSAGRRATYSERTTRARAGFKRSSLRRQKLGNPDCKCGKRYGWLWEFKPAKSRKTWGFERASGTASRREPAVEPVLGGNFDGSAYRVDCHQFPAGRGVEPFEHHPPITADRRYVSDRRQRIGLLGNGVVPQVVYPIACAIKQGLEVYYEMG